MGESEHDETAVDRIKQLRAEGLTPSQITSRIQDEELRWHGERREWSRGQVMNILSPPKSVAVSTEAAPAPSAMSTGVNGPSPAYRTRPTDGVGPTAETQRLGRLISRVDDIVFWSALLNGGALFVAGMATYADDSHVSGLLMMSTGLFGAILVVCAVRVLLHSAANLAEIRDLLRVRA